MAGTKTTVKSHNPVMSKTGKVTLQPTVSRKTSVSAKIAAKKSTKQRVVSRAKAGRGK